MRLHGILADEQSFSNLPIAESCRHGFKDLELPWSDSKLFEPHFVSFEGPFHRHFDLEWHGHLPHKHRLPCPRQLQAEPYAERCEEQRDDAAVDLERMLQDEKPVLDQLERGNEHTAEDAVKEHGFLAGHHHAIRDALPGGRAASAHPESHAR